MKVVHIVGTDNFISDGVTVAAFGLYREQVRRGVDADFRSLSSANANVFLLTWEAVTAVLRNDCVVHLHGFFNPRLLLFSLMLRFLKIPYFLSVHGALERDALRVSRIRKLVFRAVFGDRLVRSAVAVIVASNKESASVRQGFPEIEIYLIPVGVIPMSDSSSECSAKGSRSYALVLSRLDRSKGLDLLIEAWASQRRERVLLVAGPDERGYRKELEEIVLTLGLAEAVFFIGEVRGAEKWKLIRDAEMLILPSLSENFGIVVVEALAVGTLVLTTINTPWTTVGVENGCLCVTPDVSGLADGIAALDSLSEEHRQAASMRARNYARRFDWRFIDVTSYLDLASRYV